MDDKTRELYEKKALVIQAIAQPVRLAIVDLLADGEQCVCDITEAVGAERSNVSRHLAVLLNAGIVAQRKDGLRMMYSLRTPCILNFFECVTEVLRSELKRNNQMLSKLR